MQFTIEGNYKPIKKILPYSQRRHDFFRGDNTYFGKEKFVVVPYPSQHHMGYASRALARDRSRRLFNKRILVFVCFRPKKTELRKILVHECEMASDKCTRAELHNEMAKKSYLEASVFCPMPSGDSPSRSLIYDAIMCGCIPVFFTDTQRETRWVKPYEKIIPWESFTLTIPSTVVYNASANFVDVLADIPEAKVEAMQAKLSSYAQFLQYSMPEIEPTAIVLSDGVDNDDGFSMAFKDLFCRIESTNELCSQRWNAFL